MKNEIRMAAMYRPDASLEFRAADGDTAPVIRGYAVVFGAIADFGFMRERVMPGAFTRALKEKQDVRALVNHNPSMILGRTAAGTLRLKQDDEGLLTEIDPPDTQVGRDVIVSLKRGDVDQMSFGFRSVEEKWIEKRGETPIREIHDADLFDVSVVAFPAYEETSVQVRSALQDIFKKHIPAECSDPGLVEVFERDRRYRLPR